jgi:hypothetical protein
MVTYDSGTDGHYISKKVRCKAGLPIIQKSTRWVGMANGGVSQAKFVMQLPFKDLSAKAKQADTFQDFPSSLMSMGKLPTIAQYLISPKMVSQYTKKWTYSSHAKAK